MAEKRRGLGRGIGALIPNDQAEKPQRPIDVFFGGSSSLSQTSDKAAAAKNQSGEVAAELPTHPKRQESAPKARQNSAYTAVRGSAQASTQAPAEISKQTLGESSSSAPLDADPLVRSAPQEPVEVPGQQDFDYGEQELVPVPGATFGELDVTAIVPNTKQPRQIFDEDDLQELADSISQVGILQPIVVRPLRQPIPEQPHVQYELIMGERRWRASQRAGMPTIPAIVRHTEDVDLLRDALLENLHRAQLNPLEEAAAYQQMLDDFNITHEELSKKIARSRPQISNTLRLLKLPPLVQRRVAAGVISAGHARALLGLTDPAAMERVAQRIVAEGLSVRAVEEISALGETGQEPKARASRTRQNVEELNELAQRMGDTLDTRVKASMGAHKGRLVIEFAGMDDLGRILQAMGWEN